ncbi:MAG: nuclear transport factor 2 family protein [Gammaproteobacteria bacterium]
MDSTGTQSFIEQWHRIFLENDPELILPLIHDDIEFYSPAIFAPKRGKALVFELLTVVFNIFEGYRVTDTWTKGNDVLFEFEARVGKYTLQGIDRFRLNEDGKVVQMKVWIRPLSGLKELARTVMRHGLDVQLAGHGAVRQALFRAQVRARTLRQSIGEGFR